MNNTLSAITLWAPWGSLVAAGAKRFEFRSWPAQHGFWGKRIAIHQGARPMRKGELLELLRKLESKRHTETGLDPALAIPLIEHAIQDPRSIPLASVVCTASLGKPIRGAALAAELGIEHLNDSDRDAHSNWGWPLSDIRRLEPVVPARGSQGWWRWHVSEAA